MKNKVPLLALTGILLLVAIVLAGSAVPAAQAAPTVIAFDMVGSASQNLVSHTNPWAGAFGSAGDGFEKYQRGVSLSIPFSVLDDTLVSFPPDTLGIIDDNNLDEFFGIVDTENADNSGPVSAEWVFNVSGASNLSLSIDMGAMGDFESSDFFTWEAQLDGGPVQTIFTSSVDEAGSQTYTLASGTEVTLNDPMLANGELLSNILKTITANVNGSGNQLVLTLTAEFDGGSEAVAFQNIVINGNAGAVNLPPVVISTVPVNDAEYVNVAANFEIIFNEDVSVTDPWFEINCGAGPISATVSGGPSSYILDPTSDLPSSTACTVTVFAAQVVDQGDPPLNMEQDYALNFTTNAVCGDLATLISAVQGPGFTSPIVGQVVTVEGVVVGDFQESDELSGFFVQEEDGDFDGDSNTSEGVFIDEGSYAGPDVSEGDLVRATGTVVENFEQTEITAVNVLPCDYAPGEFGPVDLTLPVASLDIWETVEGMQINIPQTLYASGNFTQGRFGEVDLSVGAPLDNPTNVVAPGAPAQALQELNDRSRIQMDDGSTVQNPLPLPPYLGPDNTLRTGDTIPSLTGVIGYAFGVYEIHPTQTVSFTRDNPRLDSPDVGGSITVAAYNVLNYFTTIDNGDPICGPNSDQDCRGADTQDEFDRQKAKLVDAISQLDADIVGLMEIENYLGDVPTADLVEGINAVAGAGTYDYIATGAVGSDAIRQAILFKPAAVTPVGTYAVLDSSFDTAFDDDKNRPVLAQTFQENGTDDVVTVAVNHLKSKGSPCDDVGDPDTGDGQGNCNLTRTTAAQVIADWLATDPTGSGEGLYIINGDLNAYAMEDPVTTLEAAGYTDLIESFAGTGWADSAYSYNFFSQSGYLDHGLSSPALLPRITGAAFWHVNADEPSALDYNNYNQPLLFNPDEFRSSDHDPVVVGICETTAPVVTATASPDTLWPPNHKYVDVTVVVDVTDKDPAATIELISVTSNEPDDGLGDGDTPNDIVIVDDFNFQLRAERSGTGDGRIYTITYEVTDACGNSTIATAEVTVPKNKGVSKERDSK